MGAGLLYACVWMYCGFFVWQRHNHSIYRHSRGIQGEIPALWVLPSHLPSLIQILCHLSLSPSAGNSPVCVVLHMEEVRLCISCVVLVMLWYFKLWLVCASFLSLHNLFCLFDGCKEFNPALNEGKEGKMLLCGILTLFQSWSSTEEINLRNYVEVCKWSNCLFVLARAVLCHAGCVVFVCERVCLRELTPKQLLLLTVCPLWLFFLWELISEHCKTLYLLCLHSYNLKY